MWKDFLPTELSNPHKKNDDFAFQIYGGCAHAERILKIYYQTNIPGQPFKNTFDNIYATHQRICIALCLPFLGVFS